MGWRGSAVHWSRYETASLLLAGLATPLVVSVHTVVSFDFTIAHRSRLAQHDLSAVLRGGRHLFRICDGADAGDSGAQDSITSRILVTDPPSGHHGESHAGDGHDRRVRLRTRKRSCRSTARNEYERYMMMNRLVGPYAGLYWMLITCNIVLPQSLWSRRLRRNVAWLFCHFTGRERRHVAGAVCDRCDQPVLAISFPSAWAMYYPTKWDWATYLGTFGLFFTCSTYSFVSCR